LSIINGQILLLRVGELPINVLKHSVKLLNNQILPNVKIKHKGLFKFGINAFSLAPFCSLNSNARMIIENTNTACSKVYRLFSNQSILSDFEAVLKSSSLVNRQSLVNIDFSTFCGFETLAFAVQTQAGRAIPIWANCLTYPLTEVGSQNKFVIEEVEKFGGMLGFFPSFVLDRGFWIPDLMKFMLGRKISFYLRIKQGQKLEYKVGKKTKATTSAELAKTQLLLCLITR